MRFGRYSNFIEVGLMWSILSVQCMASLSMSESCWVQAWDEIGTYLARVNVDASFFGRVIS